MNIQIQNVGIHVFTVLHVMQRTVLRRLFGLSVYLSVRRSVKRVDCDKTKETSAHILNDILSRTVSELSQLIVQISHQRGHFDSKFQIQGVASHQSFCTDSSANECLTTLSLTVFTQVLRLRRYGRK